MVAPITASRRCYILGVSAMFFHQLDEPMNFQSQPGASNNVHTLIGGDPADLYKADAIWAEELQSLVQWSALYKRTQDPKVSSSAPKPVPATPVTEEHISLRSRLTRDVRITAAARSAVDALTTSDVMPDGAPPFTLLQTDAATVNVVLPEAVDRNTSRSNFPNASDVAAAAADRSNVSYTAGFRKELLETSPAMLLASNSSGTSSAFIVFALAGAVLLVLVAGMACLLLYYCGRKSSNPQFAGASTDSAHAYIAGLPISYHWHIEEYLPKSCGYDCAFSKPASSGRALRFQVRVEGPLCGIPLTSPLSQKPCVVYSAGVSSPSVGGLNPMSVAYAADSQNFMVSLLGAPDVRIEIRGDDCSLLDMSEGFLSQCAKFNSVPNHWQAFALSRRLSATHHSPPASRLYNEDPILEFQECALHLGAHITCVGELSRREDGVLTLHPWVPQVGEMERHSLMIPSELALASAPTGSSLNPKILASDKTGLIVLPQDRSIVAKLWANLPSWRVWKRFWGGSKSRGRTSTASPDSVGPRQSCYAVSMLSSLGHSALFSSKRPQPGVR